MLGIGHEEYGAWRGIESAYCQPRICPTVHGESSEVVEQQRARAGPGQQCAQNVPGTSSVCLSLRTPMLHFSGLDLFPSSSSITELPELAESLANLVPPNIRFHNGTFASA